MTTRTHDEQSYLLRGAPGNDTSKRSSGSILIMAVFIIGLLICSTSTLKQKTNSDLKQQAWLVERGVDGDQEVLGDDYYYDVMAKLYNYEASSNTFSNKNEAAILRYFNSSDSYEILKNTLRIKGNDYFNLNLGFDAQINQAYCGAASSSTVLNSFRSLISDELPIDKIYTPYHYATQGDIFKSECVRENVLLLNDSDDIWTAPVGLSLEQVGKLISCQFEDKRLSWIINITHVDPDLISLEDMRNQFILALSDNNSRLLINYERHGLGQVGGGHFSPIGAYDNITDSFLIMDVAKYKYPPVWAPAHLLYTSLSTIDNCGIWDWPVGQNRLPDNLRRPKTGGEWNEAFKILSCKKAFRGFITVSWNTP